MVKIIYDGYYFLRSMHEIKYVINSDTPQYIRLI